MLRGPIDYLIVGFNTSTFDGSVIKTLEEAVQKGVIAVLDLAVVSKDKNGVYTELSITDLGDDSMTMFLNKYKSPAETAHLDDADRQEVMELLDNDTTAGIVIIEHLWAKPFKQALLDKNAYLIAEGRIHPDAAAELDKGE